MYTGYLLYIHAHRVPLRLIVGVGASVGSCVGLHHQQLLHSVLICVTRGRTLVATNSRKTQPIWRELIGGIRALKEVNKCREDDVN